MHRLFVCTLAFFAYVPFSVIVAECILYKVVDIPISAWYNIFVEYSTSFKKGKIMNRRFENFTVLINRISRNIRRIENREMSEYKLRSPHISCLYHLYLSDGLTSAKLCERCEEDKATISRSLGFLEREGYIFCNSKGIKRYKNPLMLTEKGREAGQRIAEKVDDVLEKVSVGLTEEERDTFYRCFTVISENLERINRDLCDNNVKG